MGRTAAGTPTQLKNDKSDTSSHSSPPCNNTVLQSLNSSTNNVDKPSAPADSTLSPSENYPLDDDSEGSFSTDDTLTPSMEGEDSEEDIDLENNSLYGKKFQSSIRTSVHLSTRQTLF